MSFVATTAVVEAYRSTVVTTEPGVRRRRSSALGTSSLLVCLASGVSRRSIMGESHR
jgi:hypothetical protein